MPSSGELTEFFENPLRLRVAQIRAGQLAGERRDRVVGVEPGGEPREPRTVPLGRHRRALAVEHAERAKIEIAEHVRLPAVPRAGPDGSHVGRREHRQHPQHLRRAHVAGKPHHDARV